MENQVLLFKNGSIYKPDSVLILPGAFAKNVESSLFFSIKLKTHSEIKIFKDFIEGSQTILCNENRAGSCTVVAVTDKQSLVHFSYTEPFKNSNLTTFGVLHHFVYSYALNSLNHMSLSSVTLLVRKDCCLSHYKSFNTINECESFLKEQKALKTCRQSSLDFNF